MTPEDYLHSIARSLLLWENHLGESQHPLVTDIKALRDKIPVKADEIRVDPDTLWQELDKAMNDLHKSIHTLPHREFYHRKMRLIEQLTKDIRCTLRNLKA